MGLLDLFKKRKKFLDNLFGELNYTTFKDSTSNFYDGTVDFDSQKIGINIDADEKGPTAEQKEFFHKIRENYKTLKENIIIPFLNKEMSDWNTGIPIINFDNEFTIDGISIPRISDQPIEWEFSFYSKVINHWVIIHFKDFEPLGTIVDG